MGVVQYILVRGDLARKLGKGAIAAQVAHASLAPITNQLKGKSGELLGDIIDKETKRWVEGTFVKKVLEVPGKDKLIDLVQRFYADGIQHAKINESSLGGELTCVGLKPYDNGRIAPYVKGLPLLDYKESNAAFVDNKPAELSDFTYSMMDIDSKEPDTSSRFSIEVDFDEFNNTFGKYYSEWRKFIAQDGKGSGDEYIDKLDIPGLEHIKNNDCRFNKYLLDSHYQQLLDAVLPKSEKPKFVITSLEGIFFRPGSVFIYGGCSKK